jgi:hypothetical protein
MSGIDEHQVSAWRAAAADLGVRVVAPYELLMPGKEAVLCEAHVLDFGTRQGAVALSFPTERRIRHLLRARTDLWFSTLGDSYRTYERKDFIEMLDDWGWYGPADAKPQWFTGRPWS